MSSITPGRPLALLPVPGQNPLRPMFRSLGIAASGLSAQRQRMETIAQNLANADVTRGLDGTHYKRRSVVLESATAQNAEFNTGSAAGAIGQAANAGRAASFNGSAASDSARSIEVPVLPIGGAAIGVLPGAPGAYSGEYGVRVAGFAEDQGEGRKVYEPGHPDADKSGYVTYPAIDTAQEMVALMDAKRMYEANASVFQTAKAILRASLDI